MIQPAKKDLVSLKSIYSNLFKKIIIRPLSSAEIQMTFVFSDPASTNSMIEVFLHIERVGGERWIRTIEGIKPTDLQSVAFDHSAIPPQV